jgi:hypothetical protein
MNFWIWALIQIDHFKYYNYGSCSWLGRHYIDPKPRFWTKTFFVCVSVFSVPLSRELHLDPFRILPVNLLKECRLNLLKLWWFGSQDQDLDPDPWGLAIINPPMIRNIELYWTSWSGWLIKWWLIVAIYAGWAWRRHWLTGWLSPAVPLVHCYARPPSTCAGMQRTKPHDGSTLTICMFWASWTQNPHYLVRHQQTKK